MRPCSSPLTRRHTSFSSLNATSVRKNGFARGCSLDNRRYIARPMQEDWTFIIIGICAALLAGIAKTGVPGAGILVVPLMAMIFPAKTSVGALLPLLLAGDVAAVLFFHRHANWTVLNRLMPWTLVGIALAALVLRSVTDSKLKPLLGLLVLTLLLLEILRRRFRWLNSPHQKWFTAGAGVLTGFATTAGNMAGPVANIFLAGKGFAKLEFMGTVAWFFLIINALKMPVFVFNGMITAKTLHFDLLMLPALVMGGIIGRGLLHLISDRVFLLLVMLLAAVAAVKLLI